MTHPVQQRDGSNSMVQQSKSIQAHQLPADQVLATSTDRERIQNRQANKQS